MQEILDRPLVWWRDVPIDVEIGLLSYLSRVWNNTIYIVSANDYEMARKQCNWATDEYSNVHLITGPDAINGQAALINQLISDDRVLHLSSGIKGGHRVFLDKLNSHKGKKCVFIMELPSLYGSPIKRTIKRAIYPVLYRGYFSQYAGIVSGLFSMGRDATREYKRYGWGKTLAFMYLPKLESKPKATQMNDVLRMLYIGRFDFKIKGLDVMMKAIDMLPQGLPWRIDLVGGYGKDKDQVLTWCKHTAQAQYIGTWSSDEVVEKMAAYDVCIVPSRYDGWNMTPQQAIHAGIGCIVTNGAGSQELIERSGAGRVIPRNDPNALSKAIEEAARNPAQVQRWKDHTQEYVDKISIENVGKYFVEGLSYFYGFTDSKPQIPW